MPQLYISWQLVPVDFHSNSLQKMEGADQQSNPCAICLRGMGAGGGQAIFTAECSHTFHFNCISSSVAHGHLVCPLCNTPWRELPFVRPTPTPVQAQPVPMHILQHRQPPAQQAVDPVIVFDDDDQVADSGPQAAAGASSNGAVVVKMHTEYSALARDESRDNFAVLVHVRAPGMSVDAEARAPLDLVTVLDVSGSMEGNKLALLKQAMRFVIDNLGPGDRLCVVSFSSGARRETRLARMSDAGKAASMAAVDALAARGGTNIAEGLSTAAKVLNERRHRNAVSSVILLSDGQDNHTMMRRRRGNGGNYEELVPPSFVSTGATARSAPVHTFGFGNDHDAAAMHVIAEATGGTFSFIENEAVIQDAFAQCIGGLLSVVVQDARVAVSCVHPGVRVMCVKSGRYESRVDEDGRAASVRVGELYADEERRFLLYLAVPRGEAADGDQTALLKVVFSYRAAAGGGDVSVAPEDTVVTRPEGYVEAERSVEVERERARVEAAEDIAAARAAAERGAHEEAAEILENRQRAVAQTGGGSDPMITALGAELREMRGRVMNRQSYARSGRAYMLAGMSAHGQQRANSRQIRSGVRRTSIPAAYNAGGQTVVGVVPEEEEVPNEEATMAYATPAMRAMLLRSRMMSAEQGHQQAEAGEVAASLEPRVGKP
ncbi:uncharacterized protein LOC100846886 isoform X2 [Brachypodium distachyon]|uniref:uncharacterized protein LOC100846886 isoform X2 n=1 Tax=Brachypodium distachyon TaxID=15368 RepID=UPI000D0D6F2D|nr:uncharacterized protein LOC100846886 isoform X2 [Brachypodium distachyon]|eukprot:XP_010229230.2 uncharacterized protein LOC100846886 isoform X2 [Brachypodium distachyon]